MPGLTGLSGLRALPFGGWGGGGAVYYVDPTSGNDGNSGLSPADAWQTIGKVNGEAFLPGDSILFKRGETFNDAILCITWSGTSGQPIRFADYGTGALPIFTPADTLPLYTNAALRSYIEIENLDFAVNGTGNYAGQAMFAHTTIEGCVFREAVHFGLLLEDDSDDVTIRNCIIRDNGDSGIVLYGAVTSPVNCIVEDNTVYDNGTDDFADHGIYAHDGSGHIIRRNICYTNASAGIKLKSCDDCEVTRNYCHTSAKGIIVSNEAGADSLRNLIANNDIYNNLHSGIELSGDGVDSNEVYFNTIVNNSRAGSGGDAGIYIPTAGAAGNVIKNNLIHQDNALSAASPCIRIVDTATRTANTFDYNLLRYLNHSSPETVVYVNDVGYYTMAAWQALGEDVNGVNADPVFVTDYSNRHIQVTSPCRGAGVAIAGITDDYDGVARGDPPDIGAYEYVP